MDIISFNEASTANGRIEKINANPDSTSGIVTVPKVIASGETITIPAGRVAVLPNLVIEGTLNLGGDAFIPSGSTFGDLDAQIAFKADTSYVSTQLGLKANTADLKEIGVGQTWQDVFGSRTLGTTYTNSTGKPIQVIICVGHATSGSMQIIANINGTSIRVGDSYSASTFVRGWASFIVPNGFTYNVTTTIGIVSTWGELR